MKGLTLIELILSIVVFAVMIVFLMGTFATIGRDTAVGIYLNKAHTLACSYMELVLTKSFDENENPPWTAPSRLGPDPGERDVDRYDDVDDFNGYSSTDIPGYPGFRVDIEVYYVYEGASQPDEFNWNTRVDYTTNYKRIDIKVSHPQLGEILVSNGVSGAGHTTD